MSIFIFILCIVSLFCVYSSFQDPLILPKWYAVIAICLAACLIFSIQRLIILHKKKQPISSYFPVRIGFIISFCCWLQALYGIAQYIHVLPPTCHFPVSGSFDNPAGFAACLCAGFPITLWLFLRPRQNKTYRIVTGVMVLTLITAIIMSESRAGIVSIASVSGLWLLTKLSFSKKWKITLLSGGLLLLLTGVYFIKKDSANGRLLIWRCSWEMIKDAPLLGHGIGAFEAHYMDYQASYLSKCSTDDKFAHLADNVRNPFNEYLNIYINFGTTGILLLLSFILFLYICYYRNPTKEGYIAIYTLLSIGIFALFSYPLMYL